MAINQTNHTLTDLGNTDHQANQNGATQHIHIPRIYNAMQQNFNSFKITGGGVVECKICGEVLMDVQS